MFRSFLFPLTFLLALVIKSSANNHICDFKECISKQSDLHYDYDNNFENGTIFPWIDKSESAVKWRVENNTSPWEPGNVAPTPIDGSNYLRVDRGSTLSFGVAVLRSQTFTLRTDEDATFSFDFWIRSKWPQFTNIELYLAKNGKESLLMSLSDYSSIDNRVWESKNITFDDKYNSNLSLVFYAYCGTNIEDAVAVDNLKFQSFLPSSTDPPTTIQPADTTTTTILPECTTTTDPFSTDWPANCRTTTPPTTKPPPQTTDPATTQPSGLATTTPDATSEPPMTDAPTQGPITDGSTEPSTSTV